MKKKILAAITLCMTTSVFADGCMSLKNTTWVGKAQFYDKSKQSAPVNVRITQVAANRNQVYFNIAGTINGEALKGSEVCNEQEKNKIAVLTLESAHYDLHTRQFSPNAKMPNKILGLSGTMNGDYVDGDSIESYLIKS